MATALGITFAGVFASFLLWVFYKWLIGRVRDNRTRRTMRREIDAELQMNIGLLDRRATEIQSMLEKGEVSSVLSVKLSTVACENALVRGEARLFADCRIDCVMRNIIHVCSEFNATGDYWQKWMDSSRAKIKKAMIDNPDLASALIRGQVDLLKAKRDTLVCLLEGLRGEAEPDATQLCIEPHQSAKHLQEEVRNISPDIRS